MTRRDGKIGGREVKSDLWDCRDARDDVRRRRRRWWWASSFSKVRENSTRTSGLPRYNGSHYFYRADIHLPELEITFFRRFSSSLPGRAIPRLRLNLHAKIPDEARIHGSRAAICVP